jgi:hypothetical protein
MYNNMSKQKISLEEIKKIPSSTLLQMINKMKEKLSHDKVVIDIFKDYNLDIEELDYVPMMFSDLDVSAKCDHGIIYFNYKLLCDGDFEKDYSYATHELTHWAQQTAGDKPTQSSDDGSYLENPAEQEGFQNQVEYIAEHNGDNEAEKYVDHLLEYHEVNDEQKPELEEVLTEKI